MMNPKTTELEQGNAHGLARQRSASRYPENIYTQNTGVKALDDHFLLPKEGHLRSPCAGGSSPERRDWRGPTGTLLILHWELLRLMREGYQGLPVASVCLDAQSREMNIRSEIPQPSNNPHSGHYSGLLVTGLPHVWRNQAPSDPKAPGSLWKVQRRPSQDWVAQSWGLLLAMQWLGMGKGRSREAPRSCLRVEDLHLCTSMSLSVQWA